MSRRRRVQAQRTAGQVVARVVQQPYDFAGIVRTPRLGGGTQGTALYCQFNSNLNAATGTWPNLTPGKATGVQIYQPSFNSNSNSYSLTTITSGTVLNYSSTTFNSGKTTEVKATTLSGVFATVVQDC